MCLDSGVVHGLREIDESGEAAAIVCEPRAVPARAFFANPGVHPGGEGNIQVRGEGEGIPNRAVTPAQHITLVVNFHVLQANAAKFSGHEFRPFTFVKGGRGYLGDGHLECECPLMGGLYVGKGFPDFGACLYGFGSS